MPNATAPGVLRRVKTSSITRNPENPRLFFRDEDMDPLIESIGQVGILVPLNVYEDGADRYVLLDGERRWRAARKLSMATVPAIVQRGKPDRLENILRMFNIHNVRKEWDQLASALKLGTVMELVKASTGHDPSTKELASLTGLTPSAVRRLFDILALPDDYKNIVREELKKPKAEQRFTEDFFFELQKALKTVRRHLPEFFDEIPEKRFADSLIRKYRDGVVESIIEFRNVSRIARGEKSGVKRSRIVGALSRLVSEPSYPITKAYEATVEHPLWEKDLRRRVKDLREKLEEIAGEQLDDELRDEMSALDRLIQQFLR